MEIYGPDKLGTYQSETFKKIVKKINQAIAEDDGDCVDYYLNQEHADKYYKKLYTLYTKAGWDEVNFDWDYDEDYGTVKMTLRNERSSGYDR